MKDTKSQKEAFEAWALDYNSDFDGFSNVLFTKNGKGEYAIIRVQDAWEAWQAALKSPEVQALYEALKEVVDAADGKGWEELDASLEKQRAALAIMEKQK